MQRVSRGWPAGERGQASIEQLALIVVLAVVLIGAAGGVAAASPTIRNAVTTGFQRALCNVSGERCAALDRQPCRMGQSSAVSGQSVDLGLFHIGHDKTVTVERESDGSYVLSAQDGGDVGGTIGVGASAGGLKVKAGAQATAGLSGGRVYKVANAAAAAALLHKLKTQALPSVRALLAGGADALGLRSTEPDVQAYTLSAHDALNLTAGAGGGGPAGGGGAAARE